MFDSHLDVLSLIKNWSIHRLAWKIHIQFVLVPGGYTPGELMFGTKVCKLMNTMIICTTRGLDYWAEAHLLCCVDRENVKCAWAEVGVFLWEAMGDQAIGIYSSPPRSKTEAGFVKQSHWLCILKEFLLCKLQLGNNNEYNALKIIMMLLRNQVTKVVFLLCSFIVFSDINKEGKLNS